MTVIQQIEKIRKYRKISKTDLARAIGIRKETYGRISNETKDMKVSDLLKIAKVLNVKPEIFFKDDDLSENNIINGNYNNIGIGNSINIENESLKKEIELLKQTIKDKEKIIELLTKK